MEDIERIKSRLENIQSVEPIITSLRTIAAGGWRLALRNTQTSRLYVENLSHALAGLLPQVGRGALAKAHIVPGESRHRRVIMLVIASERGLCGAFNDIVLQGAERLIAQQQLRSDQVFIATLGSRATAHFSARGRELFSAHALPLTRVASFELVRDLSTELLGYVDSGEIDAVYAVYSPYQVAGLLPPVSRLWVPVESDELPVGMGDEPSPIVESDRDELLRRALGAWVHVRLYQFVIESAASEQAARFRAMEAASNNLARIIDELTLSYHTARQHAITMEMLDLVAGAGILRRPSRRGRA